MDKALNRAARSPQRPAPGRSPAVVLALAAAGVGVGVVLFLTLGAKGNWDFVLPFRGLKLGSMAVVATAIGVSTIVFQTIAGNRLLTPSLMGFSTLYVLIQTLFIAVLGNRVVNAMSGPERFAYETAAMTAFAVLLYRFLFSGGVRGLHLLMLVGMVFSIFFHSLSLFLQRILDPNAFLTVQDRLFASFNRPDGSLLALSAGVMVVFLALLWRMRHDLDIMGLGRSTAISLGIPYQGRVMVCLLVVSVMTAIATALVGPMLFLGLLVAHLTYRLMPSHRHALMMPMASLTALICLLYGQVILEQLLSFQTALGVVVEFVGGVFFLVLLLRGGAK